MGFNVLPIQVRCGWCHAKKKLLDGTWVMLTPEDKPAPGVLISHGMCDDCEQRWDSQESAINTQIQENERRLRSSLPKLVKRT